MDVDLILDSWGVSVGGGSVARVTAWLKVVGPPMPSMLVSLRSLKMTVWLEVAVADPT
jgi:hypothetical protein